MMPSHSLADALPDARYFPVPGTHMSSVTKPEFGAAIVGLLASSRTFLQTSLGFLAGGGGRRIFRVQRRALDGQGVSAGRRVVGRGHAQGG